MRCEAMTTRRSRCKRTALFFLVRTGSLHLFRTCKQHSQHTPKEWWDY